MSEAKVLHGIIVVYLRAQKLKEHKENLEYFSNLAIRQVKSPHNTVLYSYDFILLPLGRCSQIIFAPSEVLTLDSIERVLVRDARKL